MDAKQLQWRCRRGVRELDVIFGRFVSERYPSISEHQRLAFERLLEVQDPQIMDWLFGREVPDDAEFMELIASLQDLSGLKT